MSLSVDTPTHLQTLGLLKDYKSDNGRLLVAFQLITIIILADCMQLLCRNLNNDVLLE